MRLIIALLIVVLSACTVSERKDAKARMLESRDNYTQCLKQGPPVDCESLRLIYEAEKDAYDALTPNSYAVNTVSTTSTTTDNAAEEKERRCSDAIRRYENGAISINQMKSACR